MQTDLKKPQEQTGEQPPAGEEQTTPASAPPRAWARWLARWQGREVFSGTGFEGQRYLAKWLLLGSVIGIVAGLGAIVFYLAIQWATELFLGTIVGYMPPAPVGEGAAVLNSIARPWLLPLVTGLGGLVSGIIVFNLAPEAEGHGTDAAIDAIHHKGGRIRPRIPPIKLVASAITIGSGGSGGREGPAAQISAGFASLLSDWLKLNVADRRIAVSAGMGAGIGAIFRAPLGGAVMAAEILYLHDLEVEALIPSLIASIVGYSVYGALFGYSPIFGAQPQLGFDHPVQLLYYAALGVACGVVGLLYSRSFYGITDLFHRIKLPRWFKPAIGGVLVGLLGLVLPGALHMGYGWVQLGMTKDQLLGFPLWVVLLLPFAKILSTSLSIGSGGSGGIFGPGMVIGGMLGATFWRLGESFLPQMPSEPAPFVIIGMMALFGGIAHAPLAVMLMVAEMTGNLSLLAPAMVAVAISTALVGNNTIYRSQLPTRANSPAHRVRFSFPLLSALLVRDALSAPGSTIRADAPLADAQALMGQEGSGGVVVVGDQGDTNDVFLGVITPEKLSRIPPDDISSTPASAIISGNALTLSPSETLQDALEKLSDRALSWAPVVENKRLIGRLTARNIMRVYKATLQRSVSRTRSLTDNTAMFEAQMGPTSQLVGRTLREISWPPNSLVVSVNRGGETIFPRATTRLEAGDRLLVMADVAGEQMLRAFLEGP